MLEDYIVASYIDVLYSTLEGALMARKPGQREVYLKMLSAILKELSDYLSCCREKNVLQREEREE